MLKFLKKTLFILFTATIATSCISRIDKHGYMFELSDYQLLESGVTSKESVLQIMGSPTIVENLDEEESWIYYSEDRKSILFLKPDIITRNLLLIKFDNSSIIKELQSYDLSNEAKIEFASNYTEVQSNKIGFFQSIFSNIGQVKASR